MPEVFTSPPGEGFPWGRHALPKDKAVAFQVGALTIWCKSTNGEICIATTHTDMAGTDGATAKSLAPPEDNAWGRWALRTSDTAEIRIDPAYPNLPVVVKPEMPFRLIEEAQARIYVRVPLFVQVSLFGPPNILLFEAPTVILSKTWFGSFTEGNLCYWISSGARRRIDPDLLRPYLSICPLQVVNKSREELRIEKLSLHVENLAIFRHKGQLWADESKIIYRGPMSTSELEVAGVAPAEAAGAEILAPSRNPLKRGLASATFAGLRSIPGFGFFFNGV